MKIGCRLAEEVGLDSVNTSTGFTQEGAPIDDLILMRESVAP